MTDRTAGPSLGERLKKRLQKQQHLWRLHRSVQHLHGPKERAAAADDVVLIALVRDGSYYLDAFFDYYRGLGIRHFAFVDNGSCDDTVERLKQEPGVALLQSSLPWGAFENDLRNLAVRRYGRDRWCLIVDMDEIFDFEGRAEIGLSGLTSYLGARGYTGLMAQMLEMFPKAPLHSVAQMPYAQALIQFDHCDISAAIPYDYGAADTGLSYFLHQNTITDPAPKILFGGIRGKVFHEHCCLSKHPLIFAGPKVRPALHPHASCGLHLPPMTALIKHYKFANDSLERDRRSLASASIAHGEDRLRLAVMNEQKDLSLWSESAAPYCGISSLQQQGFLQADPAYTQHILSTLNMEAAHD